MGEALLISVSSSAMFGHEPARASSALISRSERCRPERVWRNLSASSTTSGRVSPIGLRPQSLPFTSRAFEPRDQAGLLVLCEGTRDLAHHHARRIGGVAQVVAAGGDEPHAALDQEQDAKLLRHQVARKATGVLDHHGAHAIALDAVE